MYTVDPGCDIPASELVELGFQIFRATKRTRRQKYCRDFARSAAAVLCVADRRHTERLTELGVRPELQNAIVVQALLSAARMLVPNISFNEEEKRWRFHWVPSSLPS